MYRRSMQDRNRKHCDSFRGVCRPENVNPFSERKAEPSVNGAFFSFGRKKWKIKSNQESYCSLDFRKSNKNIDLIWNKRNYWNKSENCITKNIEAIYFRNVYVEFWVVFVLQLYCTCTLYSYLLLVIIILYFKWVFDMNITNFKCTYSTLWCMNWMKFLF